jgi:hypothetical protein
MAPAEALADAKEKAEQAANAMEEAGVTIKAAANEAAASLNPGTAAADKVAQSGAAAARSQGPFRASSLLTALPAPAARATGTKAPR